MTAEEFEATMSRRIAELDASYTLKIEEAKKTAREEAVDSQRTIQMIMQGAQALLEVLPTIIGPGDGAKAVSVVKSLLGAGAKVVSQVAPTPIVEAASSVA